MQPDIQKKALPISIYTLTRPPKSVQLVIAYGVVVVGRGEYILPDCFAERATTNPTHSDICRNALNINFSLNIQGHLVGAGMFSDV